MRSLEAYAWRGAAVVLLPLAVVAGKGANPPGSHAVNCEDGPNVVRLRTPITPGQHIIVADNSLSQNQQGHLLINGTPVPRDRTHLDLPDKRIDLSVAHSIKDGQRETMLNVLLKCK